MMYWTGIMPLCLFSVLHPVVDLCMLSAVRILTVFMMHKTLMHACEVENAL
jgi:hypothetical protein